MITKELSVNTPIWQLFGIFIKAPSKQMYIKSILIDPSQNKYRVTFDQEESTSQISIQKENIFASFSSAGDFKRLYMHVINKPDPKTISYLNSYSTNPIFFKHEFTSSYEKYIPKDHLEDDNKLDGHLLHIKNLEERLSYLQFLNYFENINRPQNKVTLKQEGIKLLSWLELSSGVESNPTDNDIEVFIDSIKNLIAIKQYRYKNKVFNFKVEMYDNTIILNVKGCQFLKTNRLDLFKYMRHPGITYLVKILKDIQLYDECLYDMNKLIIRGI